MSYQTGDTVLVSGGITHDYEGYKRHIRRYEFAQPERCMVLGWSMRYAGRVKTHMPHIPWDGDPAEYDAYNSLEVSESIKCYMVMPLDGNRYRKPFAALAEQMQAT